MMPEVHTLTGAYATDALDDGERREFEAHLEQCPTCAQEVRELTATAARLAGAVAQTPPAELRARVLDQVPHVRQLSPVTPRQQQARRRWIREPLAMTAALLLVVAAGLAVFGVQSYQRAERAEQLAQRVSAVATDPDRRELTSPIDAGGRGMLAVSSTGDAVFRAEGLAELDSDQTYQLWVIDDGGPQSAGVLDRRGDGTVGQFVADVADGESIALTVEPSGGSSAPTTDPVMVMPVSG